MDDGAFDRVRDAGESLAGGAFSLSSTGACGRRGVDRVFLIGDSDGLDAAGGAGELEVGEGGARKISNWRLDVIVLLVVEVVVVEGSLMEDLALTDGLGAFSVSSGAGFGSEARAFPLSPDRAVGSEGKPTDFGWTADSAFRAV